MFDNFHLVLTSVCWHEPNAMLWVVPNAMLWVVPNAMLWVVPNAMHHTAVTLKYLFVFTVLWSSHFFLSVPCFKSLPKYPRVCCFQFVFVFVFFALQLALQSFHVLQKACKVCRLAGLITVCLSCTARYVS